MNTCISQILQKTQHNQLVQDAQFCSFIGVLERDFAEYIEWNEHTISLVVDMYEYFKAGPNSKLRIHPLSISPDSVAIQIHSTDIKFITDSIREYLNEKNYKCKLILDPVFQCKRDANKELLTLNTSDPAPTYETLLHIEIKPTTHSDTQILQRDLAHILASVEVAVSDYTPLLHEIHTLQNHYQTNKHKGESPLFQGVSDFIQWLLEDNFIFLGYRVYSPSQSTHLKHKDKKLGVFKLDTCDKSTGTSLHTEDNKTTQLNTSLFFIDKMNTYSVVHKRVQMDCIQIHQSDGAQGFICHQFIGLFTQKAISEHAHNIPLLRIKLEHLLLMRNIVQGSTMHREIRDIFNSIPKEVLFSSTADELYPLIRIIIQAYREQKVKVFLHKNFSARSLCIVVAMNEKSVSTHNLKALNKYFKTRFKASLSQYYSASSHSGFCQVYYFLSFETSSSVKEHSLVNLEEETTALLKGWEDYVSEFLEKEVSRDDCKRYLQQYLPNFPKDYQSHTSPATTIQDMRTFDIFFKTNTAQYKLINDPSSTTTILRIYSHKKISLTAIMPILENLGLSVLNECSYRILHDNHPVHLQVFSVTDQQGKALDQRICAEYLEEAIEKVIEHKFENGELNALITSIGFHYSKVTLLRTYYNYYFQIERVFARRTVSHILIRHSNIVRAMYQFFECKFHPDIAASDRKQKLKGLSKEILDAIKEVRDISEDRVLKAFYNLIDSTVRTNFFSRNQGDDFLIAIKVESGKVLHMPDPKPLYEIYVYSPMMQGIHLRGGMIARGGLRWSDRVDDFRTEVLALMKTQKTKNAVIVPSGAKGGFIINSEDKHNMELLKTQYQRFISALLDLTDNIIHDKVTHHKHLICYDGPDPYLVVAADKGTAHLSDAANEISAQYNFWLGDAFASGGSYGYDHKKQGITAKGAWECVKRHFREIGKDIQKEEFTVLGLGDMSGDVFGNGMLLSQKILLKAAFNHIHIFIDPDPRAEESYKERKRLFNLPKSTWLDYNPELISKGGGVFERKSKAIPLTKEIRDFIRSDNKQLSGDELIHYLLKAKVELLWNGGIGTYVKASTETHEQVEDKTNDSVRVNANELKALVVGEGGNLGFTQLARIEYAYNGGRINTDAIDNSAGVDMSDHEVNVKILFKHLMDEKLITSMEERNHYLVALTEPLNHMVIQDNYLQSLALSIDCMRSQLNIDRYKELLTDLTSKQLLNGKSEFMPTDQEISTYKNEGKGLLRPQMAILMAYEKMHVYNELLASSIPDLEYCQEYLISYFPTEINQMYKEGILAHKLKREIIATVLTNYIVNNAGVSFFYEIQRDSGSNYANIAGSYLFINEALEVSTLRHALHRLDLVIPSEQQYTRLRIIEKTIRAMIGINIHLKQYLQPQRAEINEIRTQLHELREHWFKHLSHAEKKLYHSKMQEFEQIHIPHKLAKQFVSLEMLNNIFIYLPLAKEFGKKLLECHQMITEIIHSLELEEVLIHLNKIQPSHMWDQILANHLKTEYKSCIYDIARIILRQCQGSVDKFLKKHTTQWTFFSHLVHQQKQAAQRDSFDSFVVLLRFLKQIAH